MAMPAQFERCALCVRVGESFPKHRCTRLCFLVFLVNSSQILRRAREVDLSRRASWI
jgi:hypothetical protein